MENLLVSLLFVTAFSMGFVAQYTGYFTQGVAVLIGGVVVFLIAMIAFGGLDAPKGDK